MGFAAEQQALKGAFLTGWAANQSTYPAEYDGSPKVTRTGAYVVFTVLPGRGERIELGSGGQARFAGVVIVQIFIPEGGGVQLALTIADLVVPILKEKQIATSSGGLITTYQTSVQRVGQEGSWIQYNAVTPYKREEAA